MQRLLWLDQAQRMIWLEQQEAVEDKMKAAQAVASVGSLGACLGRMKTRATASVALNLSDFTGRLSLVSGQMRTFSKPLHPFDWLPSCQLLTCPPSAKKA